MIVFMRYLSVRGTGVSPLGCRRPCDTRPDVTQHWRLPDAMVIGLSAGRGSCCGWQRVIGSVWLPGGDRRRWVAGMRFARPSAGLRTGLVAPCAEAIAKCAAGRYAMDERIEVDLNGKLTLPLRLL